MKQINKDLLQYTTAIGFLCSGIIMCFLSFFLHEYDIENGVLFYLGTAATFCGSVFGINLMIKNQVIQAESRLNDKIDKRIKEDIIEYNQEKEEKIED